MRVKEEEVHVSTEWANPPFFISFLLFLLYSFSFFSPPPFFSSSFLLLSFRFRLLFILPSFLTSFLLSLPLTAGMLGTGSLQGLPLISMAPCPDGEMRWWMMRPSQQRLSAYEPGCDELGRTMNVPSMGGARRSASSVCCRE